MSGTDNPHDEKVDLVTLRMQLERDAIAIADARHRAESAGRDSTDIQAMIDSGELKIDPVPRGRKI